MPDETITYHVYVHGSGYLYSAHTADVATALWRAHQETCDICRKYGARLIKEWIVTETTDLGYIPSLDEQHD